MLFHFVFPPDIVSRKITIFQFVDFFVILFNCCVALYYKLFKHFFMHGHVSVFLIIYTTTMSTGAWVDRHHQQTKHEQQTHQNASLRSTKATKPSTELAKI